MDIEQTIATRLMADTGIQAYLSVPANTPDEFMVVELTQSGGSKFMRDYSLDIDVWGKDEHARKRAHDLAQEVIYAVDNLDCEPNIFHPVTTNCYRSPDADTGRARYVVQIECSVCE